MPQATLRSVLGQFELDDLLSERETINQRLQDIMDNQTDPWGVKISAVEIKHIDLPNEMQRAMAKQAEAERERRAKIINADGELQASQKLHEASEIMSQNPVTIQIRYLQTLNQIASDKTNTIVFPMNIDGLANLLSKDKQS
jgi:regulator of protease activity HflC (stomatin/prohibitin superfamily)